MTEPRHSDRFAKNGRKTKRVDPTAFRIIVQQQAEITALKAKVAELEATIAGMMDAATDAAWSDIRELGRDKL